MPILALGLNLINVILDISVVYYHRNHTHTFIKEQSCLMKGQLGVHHSIMKATNSYSESKSLYYVHTCCMWGDGQFCGQILWHTHTGKCYDKWLWFWVISSLVTDNKKNPTQSHGWKSCAVLRQWERANGDDPLAVDGCGSGGKWNLKLCWPLGNPNL